MDLKRLMPLIRRESKGLGMPDPRMGVTKLGKNLRILYVDYVYEPGMAREFQKKIRELSERIRTTDEFKQLENARIYPPRIFGPPKALTVSFSIYARKKGVVKRVSTWLKRFRRKQTQQ
ncbi:hypothetical protein HY991_05840 [Candidatus Micrarchaeota archaeon]|nr:hypothetical protein [Candidatus Micrarchaeota archaeon]